MKRLALLSISILLVLALLLSVAGCGEEETATTSAPPTETTAGPATVEPIELSMVSFIPDIPPGGNWARDFIDKIVEYSGGAMTVKLSGPEAIPAPDQVAAVQRGTIDIASVLSPFGDTLVPGSSTIGRAEYDPMELRAAGGVFTYFQEEYAKHGILYLGASVSSEPQVQTVFYLGREIDGLEDLKGMKIAAVGGSHKSFISALGATTVPIDFTEYFTAMERGTVDGYNVGIPGILDFGLTPVTKAVLNEPFSSCGGMMLMNMEKWNTLTPAQQDVIERAMIQTEIDAAAMFTRTVEETIAQITADGVKEIRLTPEESKAFYLKYRESMWAEDMARWPDVAPKLKEWLTDPAFPRAN